MSLHFRKWQRLRKCYEFQKVRQDGIVIHARSFIFQIYIGSSDSVLPIQRLGIIASKKVGNAVRRNLGKRLIREIFRLYTQDLPQVCDLVVILRKQTQPFVFTEMLQQYLNCCKKIKSS